MDGTAFFDFTLAKFGSPIVFQVKSDWMANLLCQCFCNPSHTKAQEMQSVRAVRAHPLAH